MSFANLEWYGWIIFVLTLASAWSDAIRAGILVMHADKVHGRRDGNYDLGSSFLWTAIGIALTLYWMVTP